ncbi:MAG: hypothetical protein WD645_04190, partial [Dehalococcoidia bacterium]
MVTNPSGPELSVINLAIQFDAGALQLESVRGGDSPWSRPIVSINRGDGLVRVGNVRASGVGGSFTLAVLVFRVGQSAMGTLPLTFESAAVVSVSASPLAVDTQNGAIVASGGMPLTPTPPLMPTPPLVPTPTPTLPPTPTLTPVPTLMPSPPLAPPPGNTVLPTPTAPTPTLMPTPFILPVFSPGPAGPTADFAWDITLSMFVGQGDAARMDSFLQASGIDAETAVGGLTPRVEDGTLVYRLPVQGIRETDGLSGVFNLELGALALTGVDGSGQVVIAFQSAFGSGANVRGEARLVPEDGALRVEIQEPRLSVRSGIIPASRVHGVHPDAGQVAVGIDAALTSAP